MPAFQALFVSDSQADPDTGDYSGFSQLLQQAMSVGSDIRFVLHGGDLINDGASKEEWDAFLAAIKPIEGLPFYPAWGNHDDGGYLGDMFELPQNGPDDMKGRFYSFSYENAHFIVMDSNHMGLHKEEYTDWLKQDIANTGKQWNILVMHHPLYTATDDTVDAMRAETQREIWGEVMEEAGIDLVLCGHQHVYMRSKPLLAGEVNPQGIVYLMASSGGKGQYVGISADYVQVLNDDVNSFCLLSVSDDAIGVTAYDSAGTVIDDFRITESGVEEGEVPSAGGEQEKTADSMTPDKAQGPGKQADTTDTAVPDTDAEPGAAD